MAFVVWLPLALQLIVPLGLIAWLAFGRPSNRGGWLALVAFSGSYLVAIGVGGLWLILPWYTASVHVSLWLIATARSWRRVLALPWLPRGGSGVAGVIVKSTAVAAMVGVALYLVSGWRTPVAAVELQFPLRNGTYLVVNGGGNTLINAHLGTLRGERSRRWRGQSHGVDIVKLDRTGMRADGVLPSDPSRYAIFGEAIHAPCTGQVLAAVDGVAEMRPPVMDRENMSGNHVLIDCDGVWIELAHLQRGSVMVQRFERVVAGQRVGAVGNTGNSNEPHLHIHAQRPGTHDEPLSGEPLHIRFGNDYPVRNMRIIAPEWIAVRSP